MRLPPSVADSFPANTPTAIASFWARYRLWFLVFLPWMLVRQVGVSGRHAAGALATWNRTIDLLDGSLRLVFMNDVKSLLLTTVFGERFTAIHHRNVLIDPGPGFAKARLRRPASATAAPSHGRRDARGDPVPRTLRRSRRASIANRGFSSPAIHFCTRSSPGRTRRSRQWSGFGRSRTISLSTSAR